MASSEAKGKNPYSELSNVKSPKLSPLKKKKPMDKNLVESECKEVEMKEVNDPVTHPSPSSQLNYLQLTGLNSLMDYHLRRFCQTPL
ncbi:uncharacterized protein LOC119561993 isoform X2 [Drosophila subpulchrella]|uniref:uncharacterized protein LOC119561993 isoform X2 n=1 Tax=Drosophila subpulchrella TaxID=1486046 RepID=UPI0018A1465A|nr:uncharacterized protein LOC119561993 isoform X2 [Drosophila subpulchrella]